MHEPWKRQLFEAGSWIEGRALAGAVCFELRDANIQWPAWDVLSVDGVIIDCRSTAPSDVNTHLTKSANSGGGGGK